MLKNVHPRLIAAIAILCSTSIAAESIVLPAGTSIYGELDETVTSKKKKTQEGQIVRARVWRNVVVDGQIVVRAGAPMIVRVSHVKKAKVAGRKGSLELEAVSVRGLDGSEIFLDGGYDKSGKSRMGLSIALFAVIAWPLIFLKGKNAKLETGTIFDCTVQADTSLTLQSLTPRRISLRDDSGLVVEVLYDDMDPDGKDKVLPIRFKLCGAELSRPEVTTVNGKDIKRIRLVVEREWVEDGCNFSYCSLKLKPLAQHFKKGINRFEIEVSGEKREIVLDVEL